jgi:8-oxo-dGTP diphosphatase
MITRINSAAVIIDKLGRVLITKRASNKKFLPDIWHLPGGKIEDGENPKQALIRELKEELSIDLVEIIDLGIDFIYPSHDKNFHKTLFFYAEYSGNITLDSENQDYKFVILEQLPKYLNSQSLQSSTKAVKKAISIVTQKE